MRVIKRSEGLKSNIAVRREKEYIILNWALEFRAITREIVEDILGVSSDVAYKLLGGMTKAGLLLPFVNNHTRGLRLYCLAQGGITLLNTLGVDTKKAVKKASNLARNSRVLHDLSVQKIVLKILSKYDCAEAKREVVFGKVIADAVVVTKEGTTVAVEFDKTARGEADFYARAMEYRELIMDGKIGNIFIAITSGETAERYAEYIGAKYWPVYKRAADRRLYKTTDAVIPDPEIRGRFTTALVGELLAEMLYTKSDYSWLNKSEELNQGGVVQ